MSVLQRLQAARELIADEAKWTKGHYARNKFGKLRRSSASDAVCFCVQGACHLDVDMEEDLVCALWYGLPKTARTATLPPSDNIIYYNDDRDTTHADILALLDRAIEAQEGVK